MVVRSLKVILRALDAAVRQLSLDVILQALEAAVRQLSPDVVENVDGVVVNVDTERVLWLLYSVKVLSEMFALPMGFRQLLETPLAEILATLRPLPMLVGDITNDCCCCCCCCCCSPLPCPVVSGGEGDSRGDSEIVCDEMEGRLNSIIKFDTFAARTEPGFQFGCESDRVLRVVSPALFPNEGLHLLGFFVTVGMDVGTGTGGGGGKSGNDWKEAEAELRRQSSRTSDWEADASNSIVWI
jgi:hypothetical protein